MTSVDKKRWQLTNSLITINYNTQTGPKRIRFTAASGIVADENKNKKVYEFLQKSAGKQQTEAEGVKEEYKNFDKKFGMEYFQSSYGWLSFIVLIFFVVSGGAIGGLCGFLASRLILKIGKKKEYETTKKIILIILTVAGAFIVFTILAMIIYMMFGF